ncbi:helix-turn-helix domain-containing protein [Micromonospora pattaloongensis]|uniref:helix-turn-helix domain-containing protein n=1 Tax=Micromonospora pattaloongensis TaxID=405436 RepID=UPI000B8091A7|nr:helix-turn-helix transcriptional regulator [Micromonospora pattaloongensis]
MTTSRLTTLVATTLRRQREALELTQAQLAARAGTSQAAIARIERGDREPSLRMLERLLMAMDVQLTVGLEPLDAQLDAAIAELAAASVSDRIAEAGIDKLLDAFPAIPFVLDGATAALLQGAPLPVDAVQMALTWPYADRLTDWLTAKYAHRWNEKWQEFGYLALDPAEPGAHRWQTMVGELRARFGDALPEHIEVRHGGRSYPVVPLTEVEIADVGAAALLDRYRRQRGGSPG